MNIWHVLLACNLTTVIVANSVLLAGYILKQISQPTLPVSPLAYDMNLDAPLFCLAASVVRLQDGGSSL